MDDGHVFESGDVARNAAFFGDFAQQSAHDFAAARFGQRIGEAHFRRTRNRADGHGDVFRKSIAQRYGMIITRAQRDETNDGLAFDLIRTRDDGGFRDGRMAD